MYKTDQVTRLEVYGVDQMTASYLIEGQAVRAHTKQFLDLD